ncbi:MAG: family N-acetyltransferase [Symbiobacteriaceae bacterium]|jgi:GNAT superfamily N-acetyltransferase|nr:family N-acetyltransferase [Symbiobacteriaceae bacterium]
MRIRPAESYTDYEQIAALASTTEPEPLTAEALIAERHSMPDGQVLREMVAEDEAGNVTGFSRVVRLPWWGPGRVSLWVVVDPDLRGRGTGSQLYAEASAHALELGLTRWETEVMDDDAPALRFAQSRGYTIDRHLFSSSLLVAEFDPAPFAGVLERVEASGIRFFTMADAGDTEEARRRMYAVNKATSLDIPGREQTFSTFEQYSQRKFAGSSYRSELQWIAADGDQWVGLAVLRPVGQALENGMTGVVASHRGRQIALWLKLLAIDTARTHGFSRLVTNNDSENRPMLAVNRKLGYKPEPGVYLLKRG